MYLKVWRVGIHYHPLKKNQDFGFPKSLTEDRRPERRDPKRFERLKKYLGIYLLSDCWWKKA